MRTSTLYYIVILLPVIILFNDCSKKNKAVPARTNPTVKYSPKILAMRNWHHSAYFYSYVGNPPDHTTLLNDTFFAFKMLNDSTISEDVLLKNTTDSTLFYQSKYSRPYSFSMTYNFVTDKLSFDQGTHGGGGGSGERFESL